MRLDKFFSDTTTMSRKECTIAIKRKQVSVNGTIVNKPDFKVDAERDEVKLNGEIVLYKKFVYLILNKPAGVVSATEDGSDTTVIDLLPTELKKYQLFPCGRLDKDTTGLVILTNDGQSAHRALAPKSHVEKTYRFEVADEYTKEDIVAIENGITLLDGYITKPCKILRTSPTTGEIILIEGKYHEIKRLFGARGNKITKLERISFGEIKLGNLPLGNWRQLTDDEVKAFTML